MARLTGGGFGGSAIALVPAGACGFAHQGQHERATVVRESGLEGPLRSPCAEKVETTRALVDKVQTRGVALTVHKVCSSADKDRDRNGSG